MAYTLTYSETAKGWPSFYTFYPEWMIGMNNYFYSFSGGNLWRHNANSVNRCNWYGVQNACSIKTVFNHAPLESKIFKTIALESDTSWDVGIATTDIQGEGQVGEINNTWFEEKEGAFFAYLRYADSSAEPPIADYAKRSVNGIGKTDITITGPAAASVVEFPAGVEINSILSIGDDFYYSLTGTGYSTLILMGVVTGINRALRQVTVDASCGTCTIPALVPGVTDAFFVYIKNDLVESYGLLGHYLTVTLSNGTTGATELFAITSDIMKSNP